MGNKRKNRGEHEVHPSSLSSVDRKVSKTHDRKPVNSGIHPLCWNCFFDLIE
jgi:hypothetical protein